MDRLSFLKNKDPVEIFKDWLKTAEEDPKVPQANAMVLSTIEWSGPADSDYKASSRVVLLKEVRDDGEMLFYTNYNSPKARNLKYESALNFYWQALGRQVRMEGVTLKTTRETSIKYWNTRPRESKLSQYISKQSEKLESRKELEKQYEQARQKFYGKEIPCPYHWGGYGFNPHLIEFWQEQAHRLHERLVFKKKLFGMFSKKKWKSHLLYP